MNGGAPSQPPLEMAEKAAVPDMFDALRTALGDMTSAERASYASAMDRDLLNGKRSRTRLEALPIEVENPAWLAAHFTAQSAREETGAAVIRQVASRVGSGRLHDLLVQHARDEDRHRQIFAALSSLFGGPASGAMDPYAIDAMRTDAAVFLENRQFVLLNFIVDTHISEVDSLYHLTHLRSVIPMTENHDRASSALDTLIHDEMFHVFYTGRFIALAFMKASADRTYPVLSCDRFFGQT